LAEPCVQRPTQAPPVSKSLLTPAGFQRISGSHFQQHHAAWTACRTLPQAGLNPYAISNSGASPNPWNDSAERVQQRRPVKP
jgi:hypothetical protein